jgi:hypothetical protein
MSGATPFGDKRFNWLTKQLPARIAEHLLRLLVGEGNTSLVIHHEQRIRSEFDNIAVWMLAGGLRADGRFPLDRWTRARSALSMGRRCRLCRRCRPARLSGWRRIVRHN